MSPLRLAVLLLPLVACAGGGGGAIDAGVDGGPTVDCSGDPRVTAYAPGMRATSPDHTFSYVVLSGNPSPPARGNNQWTVRALDGAGATRTDPLRVQAFMPDHGHGPSVTPSATLQPDGTFAVQPLSFFMPGVWRVTVAPVDGGAGSVAPLYLCIQG